MANTKATKNLKKKPRIDKTDNKKANNNIKKIKPQNYLYAFLILAGSICLAIYIFSWYQVKKEEKLMQSYLVSSSTIESAFDDIDTFIESRQEVPSSYFIYLGYTGDEDVYELETNLKRVIDKYKLNDVFYYIDVTELKKQDNYLSIISEKLNIQSLASIPAIIYVHNGEIIDSNILDGVNGTMLKVGDLEKLLDIYEFAALD